MLSRVINEVKRLITRVGQDNPTLIPYAAQSTF